MSSSNDMRQLMDITRWLTLKKDWLYSLETKMEKLYTVSKNKTGSWLWLSLMTESHDLLQNSDLESKKVGKTTRPFRYDLDQIPYDYTVEVTNKFKGLYLIECLKNYGWRFITLYRRWWPKPPPRKRNVKKPKRVVWRGLANSWENKRILYCWATGEAQKRYLAFAILLFSFISLHCSFKKAFLSFLAVLWNSAFSWVYLCKFWKKVFYWQKSI